MARYQLTHKAEQDIETLYEYSIRNFGLQTARSYLVGLEKLLELLADNPSWGNDYSFIVPGLQRYEYRSHAVYYQSVENDILVVRVLGYRQDPARHID